LLKIWILFGSSIAGNWNVREVIHNSAKFCRFLKKAVLKCW